MGRQRGCRELLNAGADPSAEGGEHGSALHAALSKGRNHLVEILLQRGADTGSKHSTTGLTALMVAVGRNDIDLVTLLLQHKANTESVSKDGRTPLLVAAGTGNARLVKALLEGGAGLEAKEPYCGLTALLVASELGDRDMMKVLLEAGIDANSEGGIYGNAMRAALYRQDQETKDMLKRFGGRAEMKRKYCVSETVRRCWE